MKAIELTEGQKERLIEMSNALFDDRTFHFWQSEEDSYPDGMFGHPTTIVWGGERYDAVEIHWFEFCLTYLNQKLSQKFTEQRLSEADYTNNQYPIWFAEDMAAKVNSYYNEEFEEEHPFIHPIDYLYEEFKKLNG